MKKCISTSKVMQNNNNNNNRKNIINLQITKKGSSFTFTVHVQTLAREWCCAGI